MTSIGNNLDISGCITDLYSGITKIGNNLDVNGYISNYTDNKISMMNNVDINGIITNDRYNITKIGNNLDVNGYISNNTEGVVFIINNLDISGSITNDANGITRIGNNLDINGSITNIKEGITYIGNDLDIYGTNTISNDLYIGGMISCLRNDQNNGLLTINNDLYVNGDVYSNNIPSNNVISVDSDERIKWDLRLQNPNDLYINKIMNLPIYTFKYKNIDEHENNYIKIGCKAQDIDVIFDGYCVYNNNKFDKNYKCKNDCKKCKDRKESDIKKINIAEIPFYTILCLQSHIKKMEKEIEKQTIINKKQAIINKKQAIINKKLNLKINSYLNTRRSLRKKF